MTLHFPVVFHSEERYIPINGISADLPKGCGIDHAKAQIEKAIDTLRKLSLELHAAYTEGREPDLSL